MAPKASSKKQNSINVKKRPAPRTTSEGENDVVIYLSSSSSSLSDESDLSGLDDESCESETAPKPTLLTRRRKCRATRGGKIGGMMVSSRPTQVPGSSSVKPERRIKVSLTDQEESSSDESSIRKEKVNAGKRRMTGAAVSCTRALCAADGPLELTLAEPSTRHEMTDVATQTPSNRRLLEDSLSEDDEDVLVKKTVKKKRATNQKKSDMRTEAQGARKNLERVSVPSEFYKDEFLLTNISKDRFAKYLWNTPLLCDRLALKAVHTDDLSLLKELAPDQTNRKNANSSKTKVSPSSILRQASLDRPHKTALVDSVLLNKQDFIREIIDQETPKRAADSPENVIPVQLSRPRFPQSTLSLHDSGSVGYVAVMMNADSVFYRFHAYGAYVNRSAVGVARGGKEGNQAFAKDIMSTYGQDGPRLDGKAVSMVIASLLIRDVTLEQLEGFYGTLCRSEFHDRAEYQVSINLGLAARQGRDDLLRWMLGVALRAGGIGLSPLHLEVLSLGHGREVREEITGLLAKLNETTGAENDPVERAVDVVEGANESGMTLEQIILKKFRKVSWTKKASGNYQITPFHLAAINRSEETRMFQTMVEGLGDMSLTDSIDEQGWTVLHYAGRVYFCNVP